MGFFNRNKDQQPDVGVPDSNMTGALQGGVKKDTLGEHAGGDKGNYQDLVPDYKPAQPGDPTLTYQEPVTEARKLEGGPQWAQESPVDPNQNITPPQTPINQ